MSETETGTNEVENFLQKALMGIGTAGVGSVAAHAMDGTIESLQGIDVTGLNGAHVTDGSQILHGPNEGGDFLERPGAGYLAHSSASGNLSVEQGKEISNLARNFQEKGTFTYNGQDYSVLDYMPGGDLVQMAAGSVDPSQTLMMLIQHGAKHAAVDQARGLVGQDSMSQGIPDNTSTEDNSGFGPFGAGESPTGRRQASDIPDADENARDMDLLAFEHRKDLNTAVETSDETRVKTEVHAHGRTLSIETEFEARIPNNDIEKAEASDHVEKATHSGLDESEHKRHGMRFRSMIHAHLDKMAKDEGISF